MITFINSLHENGKIVKIFVNCLYSIRTFLPLSGPDDQVFPIVFAIPKMERGWK
ncbi:hypothetical protein B4135_2842 [Caldibacillus debilis]|uniref:Uncharacterized protein n=1 Tax=Caldibacillus debilis TaxID=301148 RepID=A0A150LQ50_9BACI|nr:hypothetical protein B4135_2842 [Caldibacillus debilis]